MLTPDRRDPDERARLVTKMLAVLRVTDVISLRDLAYTAGEIPECIAARILKRFALRGLVRNVSQGWWTATAVLRVEPVLMPCPALP
jgi:hypothetical protein